MIAHGAEHPWLQIAERYLVGKFADVKLSVVVEVRMAAIDEHAVSTVTSHVGQRHGLVVKQQVRDRPGHSPSNCGTERVSKSSYSLGSKIRAEMARQWYEGMFHLKRWSARSERRSTASALVTARG
jgi:hypothetical protein